MQRVLLKTSTIVLAATLLLPAGCATSRARRPVKMGTKPTVAVEAFQDQSGFDGKWELDKGIARLVAAGLRASRDVEVPEMHEKGGAVSDFIEQGKGLLKKESAAAVSRPVRAQYIVSGAITEFSVAGDSSGWFAPSRNRTGRARVEMEFSIADAKTGAVLSSFEVKGNSSSPKRGGANYRDIPFGGKAFSETPLGKATDQALRKGLRKILQAIPPEYWQPRIAEAGPDTAIINGGENAKVRKYDEFIVREESREITDPVTGRVIETVPGRKTGRIRVTQVNETSAHAQIVEGSARRGDVLEPVQERRK